MADLSPPWVIFSDGGRPCAILPAGRPGEVADVRKVPVATVRAIVRAANQPFSQPPLQELTRELIGIGERLLAQTDIRVPQLIPASLNVSRREHWSTKQRRIKKERADVRLILSSRTAPKVPAVVTLTRCAPRLLDDDNAVGSMKSVRDEVAAWLAIDDGDERITWRVEQRKVPRKEAGTVIRIESVGVVREGRK